MMNAFILCDLFDNFRNIMQQTEKEALNHGKVDQTVIHVGRSIHLKPLWYTSMQYNVNEIKYIF